MKFDLKYSVDIDLMALDAMQSGAARENRQQMDQMWLPHWNMLAKDFSLHCWMTAYLCVTLNGPGFVLNFALARILSFDIFFLLFFLFEVYTFLKINIYITKYKMLPLSLSLSLLLQLDILHNKYFINVKNQLCICTALLAYV